ncbi:hypothetical protein KI387_035327, partial [Taxus chinensis]
FSEQIIMADLFRMSWFSSCNQHGAYQEQEQSDNSKSANDVVYHTHTVPGKESVAQCSS